MISTFTYVIAVSKEKKNEDQKCFYFVTIELS